MKKAVESTFWQSFLGKRVDTQLSKIGQSFLGKWVDTQLSKIVKVLRNSGSDKLTHTSPNEKKMFIKFPRTVQQPELENIMYLSFFL